MRSALILSAIIAVLPKLSAQEPETASFPPSRYEKLLDASPFALATVTEAPAAPKDSFTKDWVLEAISKNRDSSGVERDWVSIRSRDQTQRFQLYGTDQNNDGIAIASVERSPQVGKSKVTLKKGNEFGVVEFDQMLIESNPGGSSEGVRTPGQNVPAGGAIPGLTPNRGPNSPNNGRPQIPRPNGIPAPNTTIPQPSAQSIQPVPNPGTAPNPAAPNANQRRIRVINTKP